jgi:Ice-binding-like/Bacterial Ig-like domain
VACKVRGIGFTRGPLGHTQFKLSKMKFSKMSAVLALSIMALMAGCKKDDDPGLRPTVISTDPITSSTDRAVNSMISATFSVAMDPASISSSTFTLLKGGSNVAGTIVYSGTTATFSPSADLLPNTVYTATISTGAKNMDGKALLKDYTWTFTTSAKSDLVLPTVAVTDPTNNAVGVTLTKLVKVTFSEPMEPASITSFTVALRQGTSSVTATVTYSGSIATIAPASSLLPNIVYTIAVSTGARDMAGNALAIGFTSSFTTGDAPDTTLPLVSSTDPLNNVIGVAQNKVVAITFSEAMTPTTINASTFTLFQGPNAVAGSVAYSGTTGTFTPTANLTTGLVYTATITTGAKDVAGNALAANMAWSFTVGAPDVVLPVINSTDPLNNATGVAINKIVAVAFSEAMDPLTISASSFTLKQGTTSVTGVVAYSGTTATFTPAANLSSNLPYTATVTTNAKDMAGNALATNTVWSFTTGSSTSPNLAAVDLGAAGNYVILAKTAISNIPTSAVTGDLGLSPAATSFVTGFALTNATGFATSPQVTGSIFAADMASPTSTNLTTAVENMITAYNDAAGRPSPDFSELGTGNIGGLTLTPGLYKWTSTVTLPSSITISGGANDVWIFQISGDLTVSNSVNITLAGGAQAKNIFWQVAGTVTVGTTSHFEGVILSMTGITFQTGASLFGRALAQTAVVLDGNAITKPN